MAKITLPNIASGYATVTHLNTALDQIEAEFQGKVLYRSNPTGEPNSMSNDIDMNSYSILNLSSINGTNFSAIANLNAAIAAAQLAETNAETAQLASEVARDASLVYSNNASSSATSASSSAASAANYSSMGLGGAAAFDFGLVTDILIVFPTDWGLI